MCDFQTHHLSPRWPLRLETMTGLVGSRPPGQLRRSLTMPSPRSATRRCHSLCGILSSRLRLSSLFSELCAKISSEFVEPHNPRGGFATTSTIDTNPIGIFISKSTAVFVRKVVGVVLLCCMCAAIGNLSASRQIKRIKDPGGEPTSSPSDSSLQVCTSAGISLIDGRGGLHDCNVKLRALPEMLEGLGMK